MRYWKHLQPVADDIVRQTLEKDRTYQGSWQKSGGVSAWLMLKRKMDRLAVLLAPLSESDKANLRDTAEVFSKNGSNWPGSPQATADLLRRAASAEDIFRAIEGDSSGADGTVYAEVRDLCSYLLLVMAEMAARRAEPGASIKVDPSATIVQPKYGEYHSDDVITVVPPPPDNERRVPRLDTWVGKTIICYQGVGLEKYRHEGVVLKEENIAGVPNVMIKDKDGCGRWFPVSKVQLAPVPATDSNKYADRDVSRDDGRMVAFITILQYITLSERLKARYVVTGQYAHLDRGQYTSEDRDAKFMRLHLTLSNSDLVSIHYAMQELYEPRQGVADEYQLRQQFREHWGQ
jgi:hypothetical protein